MIFRALGVEKSMLSATRRLCALALLLATSVWQRDGFSTHLVACHCCI